MTAKTAAERKAAERARRRDDLGLEEIRGIWAPKEMHEGIKKAAARKGATVGPPRKKPAAP
jgi:hypothetical protein